MGAERERVKSVRQAGGRTAPGRGSGTTWGPYVSEQHGWCTISSLAIHPVYPLGSVGRRQPLGVILHVPGQCDRSVLDRHPMASGSGTCASHCSWRMTSSLTSASGFILPPDPIRVSLRAQRHVRRVNLPRTMWPICLTDL
jgi:hypothetical protein